MPLKELSQWTTILSLIIDREEKGTLAVSHFPTQTLSPVMAREPYHCFECALTLLLKVLICGMSLATVASTTLRPEVAGEGSGVSSSPVSQVTSKTPSPSLAPTALGQSDGRPHHEASSGNDSGLSPQAAPSDFDSESASALPASDLLPVVSVTDTSVSGSAVRIGPGDSDSDWLWNMGLATRKRRIMGPAVGGTTVLINYTPQVVPELRRAEAQLEPVPVPAKEVQGTGTRAGTARGATIASKPLATSPGQSQKTQHASLRPHQQVRGALQVDSESDSWARPGAKSCALWDFYTLTVSAAATLSLNATLADMGHGSPFFVNFTAIVQVRLDHAGDSELRVRWLSQTRRRWRRTGTRTSSGKLKASLRSNSSTNSSSDSKSDKSVETMESIASVQVVVPGFYDGVEAGEHVYRVRVYCGWAGEYTVTTASTVADFNGAEARYGRTASS